MNKQFNVMQELFGEVIYSYTREQAIADGVLVDLSGSFPTRRLYKHPIACTSAVWEAMESTGHDNLTGVVFKVLYASINNKTRLIDETSHIFNVTLDGASPRERWNFKVMCHPGDNLEPVLTIMLPEED